MNRIGIFMIGVLLLVGALSYGAVLLGLAPTWIAIGAAAIIGIGAMMAAAKARGTSKVNIDQA